MHRLMLRLLAFVAVTQVGAAGGSIASQNRPIAPDEEAWQHTVAMDTMAAYAKFALEFPASPFADAARQKLAAPAVGNANPEIYQLQGPAMVGAPEFIPPDLIRTAY
jgi:hypothetical protein